MKEYFCPDKRWDIYNFGNREDYTENVVIKGYFHGQVPDDVIRAFATAEYLMAHAYYHWEMFDEAFNKAFLIVEMAVKLKALQLNIPIERKNKKGEMIPISLGKIIKKICKANHLKDLKDRLERAQKLRNMVVHPRRHSFMGPNGTAQNIKYCMNVLNRLFNEDEWHKAHLDKADSFKMNIEKLNNHVLKVETDQPAFLISEILSFELVDDLLILNMLPILNEYKSTADSFDVEEPLTFSFKNYVLDDKSFSGILTNGKTVEIKITNKPENLKAVEELANYVSQLTKEQNIMRQHSYNSQASWALVDAEYKYYTEKYG